MNRKWEIIYLAFWILSACTTLTDKTTHPILSTVEPIATSSLKVTPSKTAQLSTITPKSTSTLMLSPSTTPAFNIASVISHTPSPPEKCPRPASVALPDIATDSNNIFNTFSRNEKKVLDYLNTGGNPSDLVVVLRHEWRTREIFGKNEISRDLTGDGVPELIITPSEFYIFGCNNEKYKTLFTLGNDAIGINFIGNQLVGIQDMNLNGIPEVIVANFGCGGFGAGQCLDVYVYEWNGKNFDSLIPRGEYGNSVSMYGGRLEAGLPNVDIQDVDNNGFMELILTGDVPGIWDWNYFHQYPWRNKSDIYSWNGRYFTFSKTEYSTPVYRYQAVQDGDRAALTGDYKEALAFYQDAIFSNTLLGWSSVHRERYNQLLEFTWNSSYQLTPTPVVPSDDPKEYPNLAAYARYRIMLLHILQDHMNEAQIVYETLQTKFPEGNAGYEFVLIAKAFWDEYQLSENIGRACVSAVSVANAHKEVLQILGSDYHNIDQDIMYEPNDVCPFK